MKTRTSQNGVAGIMSRLLHNIKSAALALAALALAAPPAWGADYTWKDGASGNTNVGSNWTGGTAPTSGVNKPIFNNTGTALSTVNNNITMSNSTRFDDGTVRNGVFSFTGNWYFKTFSMADTDNSQATVTKTGTWTCNNGGGVTYQFRYGVGKNSKASFTNESGDIGDIGTGRATRDMDFTVGHGEGSDAEFILKAGTVTSSTALVLGYGASSKGLLVMDGGAMNCKTTNVVARGTGSTGIARINGGTFTGNSKPFYVAKGANSTGTVVVNGGTLKTADVFLGNDNGANASVIVSNGTVSASGHTHIGYKSGGVTTNYFEVAGGDFSQTAANMHLYIGSEGATGTKAEVCAKGNGKMNISRSIILGNKVGGTLTVKDNAQVTLGTKTADGHVNMCYASAYNGDPSYLNLDGGTLTTKMIAYGSGTSGNAFVTFNGGTLKANQATTTFIENKARLFAKVAAGGGTIDSTGFAITIPKAIESGVSGETDGGMTFTGGGTITLSGANTYTGATVIDAGTTIQMPAASNLAGAIVVTNATLGACPITVLTLTGAGADANDIFARCSLAADAPDTVELVADGASIKVLAKASVPAFARLIYDSGTDSWSWEFRDMTDAVIPTVDQSALEAGSVTVRFGSTDELAAIAALGSAPAWVKDYQMVDTFDIVSASATTTLPAGFTVAAGTVIDLKGCAWTLPAELKSATVDFTVTNSVDATKAVLTVDVASGATFTETHLTLGGNIELRKTGEGTYAMTKDQPHTGGTVVTAGAMTSSANRTVAPAANSTGSLTIDGGTFTADADFIISGGANATGSLTVNSGTFTMTGSSRYLKLGNATGATGTVNLNGGEVVMNARGFTTGGGAGEVVFNGGTLTYAGINERALFQQNLSVKVGAGGGTIVFAAGKYPTNNLSMVSGVAAGETDGGMTFKGGGTFTELGQLAYTGGTTVEIGTMLVIPDTSLGGGLSASLSATQLSVGTTNTLVTTTGEGVFTDADLPDVSALPYYRALLSEDAKSILVTRVAPVMTVTGFDVPTGEITMGFENVDASLSLVVAWDTTDHGATLTSWPSTKRVILGTVAANSTTATFTLPDEIQVVGMYYRLFLGDGAVKPYDEEVAWIQPNGLGAYITTAFKPSANPKAEFKMNMDGQTYSSWARVFRAAAGWPNNLQLSVNSSGKIQNTRVGVIDFNAVNTTADHVITLSYQYSDRYSAIKIDGTTGMPSDKWDNYNQNQTVTPQVPITLWADADGANPSAVKLYYMKWMNTSGTVQANFIPVKKDGEYCLYDTVNKAIATNSGAEGTSFKGGAKTGYGPVTFADGQMVASDTQQYLGATVLDDDNCSITMEDATATINWALAQPGGTSADIVAVFTTGSTVVTNVIETGAVAEDTGSATVSNIYATGQITITLFARSGDNKSVEVSQTFPATTVASVPTAPTLVVDETLRQIAASGTVSLGTGTTSVWLDYGATTSYGTKIDLTLANGEWTATIPYDDALWKAGKVYVRVTAANEIAGIFGTSRSQQTATANASFTAGVRTVAQTAFDPASGTATLAFGGDAAAAQDLVVAWGDRDYGEDIASWPYNKRAVIGSVAADAETGTFTLPPEARVSGTYYRFFLGDRAVAPYDEEVEWIQPAVLGAYMNTGYTPSSTDKTEYKFNMDNQVYSDDGYRTIIAAGSGWGHTIHSAVNRDGWMLNVRAGTVRYAAKGNNNIVTGFDRFADHVVKLVFDGDVSKLFTIDDTTGSSLYHEYTDGSSTVTGNYNTYNNPYYGPSSALKIWANGGNTPSMVRLYYMKWMNSSGTVIHEYVPVVKNGEYCLYDINTAKVLHNVGAAGTSFTGGSKTGYSPVTFATVQTAVTPVRMMGTIELASRDWERPQEHVTLNWTAPRAAATLWVVYSNASVASAPGEFAAPSEWNFCTNIAASVAADATANAEPYTLCDPLGDGNKYKSMRFVLATSGSTEANLVPLVVSEPYRTLKQGSTLYVR